MTQAFVDLYQANIRDTEAKIEAIKAQNNQIKKMIAETKHLKTKDVQTQTGQDGLYFSLTDDKHVRLYYSECYKQDVMALNINSCKSFIFTPDMWRKFRARIKEIDQHFKI